MPTEKQLSRKITLELNRLEKEITIKLERFYKTKIKNNSLPTETIRTIYNDDIKNLIRKTVESSWLFSNGVLQEAVQVKFPKFQINTSVQDIQGIESITNEMNDYFWAVSGDIHLRETTFKVNNAELIPLNPFDLHANMVGLGGWFAYYAYNYAMESKRNEIEPQIKLKYIVRDDCIDQAICLPLNGRLFGPNEIPIIPPHDTHKHCHCKLVPTVV